MNSRQRLRPAMQRKGSESLYRRCLSVVNKQKCVLTVPIFDLEIIPNQIAKGIDGDKPVFRKQLRPIFRPLFVDMMDATLIWNRGTEQDHRAEGSQEGDESLGNGRRQMFGDLQRINKVKPARDFIGCS